MYILRKYKVLWKYIVIMGFFLSTSSCMSSTSSQGMTNSSGDFEKMIRVDDRERHYSLHVPSSYTSRKAVPVILNFHGGGGNSKTQRHISRMDETADREGFIVVYPQGTNKKSRFFKGYTWNAGGCCGWAQEHKIDDVKFTTMLLDVLEKDFVIDTKRVYATGISNGAIMSYRLACEMADRIAAIAPISGPMEMKVCKPTRPISIIHFHGTADQFAPYHGGAGKRSMPGQNFNSVKGTIDAWKKIQHLQSVKPLVSKGNTKISIQSFRSRKAEFKLYTLDGGGHTWPGGQFGFLGKRFLGEMNMNISANDIMWEFFKEHTLP